MIQLDLDLSETNDLLAQFDSVGYGSGAMTTYYTYSPD